MDSPATHRSKRRVLWGAAIAAVLIVAGVGAIIGGTRPGATVSAPSPSPASLQIPSPSATAVVPYSALTAAQIAALPEAKYNAVIPGLIAYDRTAPASASIAYTLTANTPVYGPGHVSPVARLAEENFLNQPTIVTPMKTVGDWALVLTPARKTLPSQTHSDATPQTAGWIRTSALHNPIPVASRIVVSVAAQTLTITGSKTSQQFQVGVGAAGTPTPTNVSGYIQARYLDPGQDQTVYPIQLTSLHSSAADEPYTGHDGGLIGVHYNPDTTGDISHGCIRLTAAAITAVNKLPLGTILTITK